MPHDPSAFAPWLWLFTVLLILRVAGQLAVVLFAPRWLPPMHEWQSGLLPYPVLVASQIIVLALMLTISLQFTAADGYFVEPDPQRARRALAVSYVYLGAMIVRYIVRMTRRPDQRWIGGTIPIVFHSFVALFIWTFARYHVGSVWWVW